MKLFLIKITCFLLVLFSLCYLLDVFFTNSLKQIKNNNYGSWNKLLDGNIHDEIIILGSSRAKVQFNPIFFENKFKKTTYNLGIDGYNLDMFLFRFKLLQKYSKNTPKILIISLDNFSLDKRIDLYDYKQFLPSLDNEYMSKKLKEYKGFDFYDYNIPFVKYIGKRQVFSDIINFYIKPEYDDHKKGFYPRNRFWNEKEFQENKKKRYIQNINPMIIKEFEIFLHKYSKKTKIILVYTPEYIEGQQIVKNRKYIINTYNKISKKYNIPFLDYSNDSITKHKNLFYGVIHLNKKGADIFTQKLIKDLHQQKILNYAF